MASKFWKKALITLGVVAGVGAVVGVAMREEDKKILRYMDAESYANAPTIPAGAPIVVLAFSPDSPLAENLEEIVEVEAERNRDVYFVLVSDEIGRSSLEMEIGWGGIAAGDGESAYEASFGPQTTADDLSDHVKAAVAALRAGATSTVVEEIETATLVGVD